MSLEAAAATLTIVNLSMEHAVKYLKGEDSPVRAVALEIMNFTDGEIEIEEYHMHRGDCVSKKGEQSYSGLVIKGGEAATIMYSRSKDSAYGPQGCQRFKISNGSEVKYLYALFYISYSGYGGIGTDDGNQFYLAFSKYSQSPEQEWEKHKGDLQSAQEMGVYKPSNSHLKIVAKMSEGHLASYDISVLPRSSMPATLTLTNDLDEDGAGHIVAAGGLPPYSFLLNGKAPAGLDVSVGTNQVNVNGGMTGNKSKRLDVEVRDSSLHQQHVKKTIYFKPKSP